MDYDLSKQIKTLIKILSEYLHEREEIVAVSLLASLTGQNIFLLGPPGTAKSLIARRLANVFQNGKYFEYLMHRFSTPEELFGPVSIAELKKDNYKRKTEGFLSTADFVFLDEIWKSSPAILNTLLTLINEKIFKNGSEVEKTPLKSLITASNETPPTNQGLEALYDRFVIRLFVEPMEERKNFENLLQGKEIKSEIEIRNKKYRITTEQLQEWREKINNIKLSNEILDVIQDIKIELADKGNKKNKKLAVYVSDRRWRNIAYFLKGAAFFCGRDKTNLSDALLLRHCLWTTRENREVVIKIVEDAVRNNGYSLGDNLSEFDKEFQKLEKEISKELYYTEDVYEKFKIETGVYFRISKEIIFKCKNGYGDYDNNYNKKREAPIFISADNFKTRKTHKLLYVEDNQLRHFKDLSGNFNGTGTCTIQYDEGGDYEKVKFTPEILFNKGDQKEGVNDRLLQSFLKAIEELIVKSEKMIIDLESHLKQFQKELETPFTPQKACTIAVESITTLLEDLQTRRKDCDRLMNLVNQ